MNVLSRQAPPALAHDAPPMFRRLDLVPPSSRDVVLVIGNFDGVHLGHQHLLATARHLAAPSGAMVAVLTFEPHPRLTFRPDDAPFRLTPARQKFRLLGEQGVGQIIAQPFDRAFANLTADDFMALVFTPARRIRHVVVGADFCFGRQRQGTTTLLRDYGKTHGFTVETVAVQGDAQPFSSSRIRDLLRTGDMASATALLGRTWQIEGQVETGRQLARQWDFPTANIALGDYLCPAMGVYAVDVGIGHRPQQFFPGVANLGRRPTVDGTTLRLEAHLFDFDEDIYGRHVRVNFHHFLRPEQRFDNLDALRQQIARDAESAKQWLTHHKTTEATR